ncbi:MAG: prepilin peptidase [Candidatus Dormibacteraeota bacterium]|nr:prepilin peptidase [Candidatus Dormibacteraeota bacterium]MBO0745246.1 prepilin peptidase [Candidatus Dormibacteraeota bacterium]
MVGHEVAFSLVSLVAFLPAPLTGRPAAAVVGAAAGVLAGLGIVEGNRRLEQLHHVSNAASAFQRWGPPALLGLTLAVFGGQAGWQPVFGVRALWAAVLVQVLFFDLAHRLILDRVLLPAAVLAFLASFVTPGVGWPSSLAAGVAAVAVFGAFAFLGRLALRGEVLGMGDVKLAGFIGLALGVQGTVAALVLGVLLAGVVAAALLVARVRSLRDTIAYGPFLCAGALLGLFLNGQTVR